MLVNLTRDHTGIFKKQINYRFEIITIVCINLLDLAHVSIPVGKGLLAGKVAHLAVPHSQCGKDPHPTVVASE